MTAHMQAAEWEPAYAARAERMRASEIRELLKLLDRPGIISFAGGIPDPALFPVREAEAAYVHVLGDRASAGSALQYSVSEGYQGLRSWIVRHMARLGVPCTEDNIVITSGSQQGLEFLGRLLLSPGDTALVMAPTYLGALQAFSGSEPRYDELNPEHGNRTPQSYADAAAANGGRVKFAYVVPDFANPTGETLSLPARERLLDLADELDVPVIEDAAYAALRFEGEPLPPIAALEVARRGSIDRARVIYCGTFSKVLSPGLRVGWIVAPRPMVRRLVLIKQASDLNSATINQLVMHRLAESIYDDRVAAARAAYRRRRDAMLAALGDPHARWRDMDAAQGRALHVGAPARGDRQRRPARAVGQRGRRRLRAGGRVLLRRPRPQRAAPQLLSGIGGRDRGRHRPAGEADLSEQRLLSAMGAERAMTLRQGPPRVLRRRHGRRAGTRPPATRRASSRRSSPAPSTRRPSAATAHGCSGSIPAPSPPRRSCTTTGRRCSCVSGDMIVGNDAQGKGGEVFRAYTHAVRPPGVVHGPFKSETGCLLLETHWYA